MEVPFKIVFEVIQFLHDNLRQSVTYYLNGPRYVTLKVEHYLLFALTFTSNTALPINRQFYFDFEKQNT